MVAQDLIKLVVYKGLELRRTHQTPFLSRLKQPLDFHAGLHHDHPSGVGCWNRVTVHPWGSSRHGSCSVEHFESASSNAAI